MMSGKTNKLVNQEGRESYYYEAVEGATVISQGDDEVFGGDDNFEASRAEEGRENPLPAEICSLGRKNHAIHQPFC